MGPKEAMRVSTLYPSNIPALRASLTTLPNPSIIHSSPYSQALENPITIAHGYEPVQSTIKIPALSKEKKGGVGTMGMARLFYDENNSPIGPSGSCTEYGRGKKQDLGSLISVRSKRLDVSLLPGAVSAVWKLIHISACSQTPAFTPNTWTSVLTFRSTHTS